jgi:uncharacterized protein YjbJ (UPF0337 family)
VNEDILQGMWKQIRGQARDWWGKLTDDDLERIAGNRDKLMGALQEKYGYTREQAQEEIERRLGGVSRDLGDSLGRFKP